MSEMMLILLFLVALFYSSVGHGGASGYIAVLTILGVSTALVKPSALLLNIFVAGIAFYQYYRKGYFRWRLFYPFAVLSVPMAYLGSFVVLDETWYKRILGICLVLATARIIGVFNPKKEVLIRKMPVPMGIVIGAALGFVSGMIGIGGGIILSPVIVLFGWGSLKETSAVSALFIVVNSIAGILGLLKQKIIWSPQILLWLLVAIAGGFIGSYVGSYKSSNTTLKNILAAVLFVASIKLIFI
jgi:uncharacterized membrane protein YfcA